MKLLIILAIMVGMWVLQYIFRDAEEEQAQQRRREAARRRPPGSRPRRSSSDLDRFLDEARRRRQTEEPIVEAEIVPEPPPVRASQREESSFPGASSPERGPRRPPPAPRPRPSAAVHAEPAVVIVEEPARARSTEEVPLPKLNFKSPSKKKGARSPSLDQVAQLLEQNGFRAAVVLKEILSPPLSRRSRRD